MTTTRAPQFDTLLRTFLPYAGDGPIDAGAGLTELGLDSINTMSLLVEIEDLFDVRFPDEALTTETFATADSLWDVVRELLPAAEEG